MFFKRLSAAVWIITTLLVSACSGGGGSDSVDPGIVMGSPSQSNFDLSAAITDAAPQLDPITIPYNGKVEYVVVEVDDQTAISNITGGPSSAGIKLNVTLKTPVDLGPGNYHTTITVSSCPAGDCANGHHSGSPKKININYTVTVPAPLLANFSAITRSATEGLSVTDTAIVLNAYASQPINWSASISYVDGQDWLSLDQYSGQTADSSTLLLSFQKLTTGTYQANVDISYSANANNYSITIPVTLTVDRALNFASSLDFNLTAYTPNTPLNYSALLYNRLSNNSEVNGVTWNATSSVNWIHLPTTSGLIRSLSSIKAEINYAEILNLQNGYYTGYIEITASDPTISALTIPVTLTRNLIKQLTLAPTSLVYDINQGSNLVDLSRTITIGLNSQGIPNDSVAWNIKSAPSWLSGNISAGDTAVNNSLTLTLDLAAVKAMSNGSVSGNVVIASNDAGTTEVSLPVTLNRDVQPRITFSQLSLSYLVNEASSLADLDRQITVQSNLGEVFSENLQWTISAKPVWLKTSMTAGDTSGNNTLALSLDVAELKKMNNGVVNELVTFSDVNGVLPDALLYVNLSLNDNPLFLVFPKTMTYNLNQASALTDLTRSITITTNLGPAFGENPQWSISVPSWMSASVSTGSTITSNQLTVTIDQAALKAMSNGSISDAIVISDVAGYIPDLSIPLTLNRSVDIPYTLSANNVNYDITEATSNADLNQSLSINSTLGEVFDQPQWTVSATPTWLSAVTSQTATGGSAVDISVDKTALLGMSNGSYSGTVIISEANGDAADVTVPVSLIRNVNKGLLLGNIVIDVDVNTVAGNLSGSSTVSSNLGEVFMETLDWNTLSSAPWLVLDTLSGDTATGNVLNWHIDVTELSKLANASYTTALQLNSNAVAVAPAQAQVTLNVNLATVSYVTPSSSSTNLSREIILRGSGFSAITNQSVLFGGQPSGNTLNIISDSEIRISHPVYTTPQSLAINIENGLNIVRDNIGFEVIEHPAMSSAVLSAAGDKTSVYYHPVRQALIYGDITNDQIVVWDFNGGANWSQSTIGVTGLNDVAISSDGNEILAITDYVVSHYNAYDLSYIKESDINTHLASGTFDTRILLDKIEMSNDGNMVVSSQYRGSASTSIYLYNMQSGVFTSLYKIYIPVITGSGNGSIAPFGGYGLSVSQPVCYFRASDNSVTESAINLDVLKISSNLMGNRVAINGNTIYDDQINLIGTVPDSLAIGFSPDGALTYRFAALDYAIEIYDSSSASGNLPLLGTVSLANPNPLYATHVVTRDDDKVLFIAGPNEIEVLPLP